MDWVFEYPEPNAAVEEVIQRTSAILAGRRSYEAGKESGEVYGGAWIGQQFVLTHDLRLGLFP